MNVFDDLDAEVTKIFKEVWDVVDTKDVPDPKDLRLNNHAKKLTATILYADLTGSTSLVDGYKPQFAAEIYKAFLVCCARIIKSRNGSITAYDGDRIMAAFVGDYKNSSAALAALAINHAVINIIRPRLKAQYPSGTYVVQHAVGIDTSELHVARIGVRIDNDLVWVGRAANYAAKLCNLREANYSTWITDEVYDKLSPEAKFYKGQNMWTKQTAKIGNRSIYGSTWWVKEPSAT